MLIYYAHLLKHLKSPYILELSIIVRFANQMSDSLSRCILLKFG